MKSRFLSFPDRNACARGKMVAPFLVQAQKSDRRVGVNLSAFNQPVENNFRAIVNVAFLSSRQVDVNLYGVVRITDLSLLGKEWNSCLERESFLGDVVPPGARVLHVVIDAWRY